MTNRDHDHAPDPDFVAHLEWQLRSALRREARFARPAAPPGRRRLRTAALVAVSLLFGAAGVVGAERVQDSRDRRLLLEHVSVRAEVARARLEAVNRDFQRSLELVERGLVSAAEHERDELALEEAELETKRLALETEAIEATGELPTWELWEPVHGERDFVLERLELDHDHARRVLSHAVRRRDEVAALHAAGVVARAELEAAEEAEEQERGRVRELELRIEVRLDFTRGEIDVQDLELELYCAVTMARIAQVGAELDRTGRRAEELRRRARAAAEEGRPELAKEWEAEARTLGERAAELDAARRLLELELELFRGRQKLDAALERALVRAQERTGLGGPR